MRKLNISILSLSICLTSCCAPGQYYDQTYCSPESNLTLGVVQREISTGMSQGEVAAALGSPNIVTKDQDLKETWIYDKIATEVRESSSSGLILFFSRGADKVAHAEKTQKTLTVVIKYDSSGLVEKVSYHSSKF